MVYDIEQESRHIKIYAVEDSEADRFFFDRALARINKGDSVSYFVKQPDLEAAIESKGPPDLMVFDLDVPGCDGMTLLEHFKERPEYRNVPIVIYTGRNSDVSRAKALSNGAESYVLKADDPRECTRAVRHFLNAAR